MGALIISYTLLGVSYYHYSTIKVLKAGLQGSGLRLSLGAFRREGPGADMTKPTSQRVFEALRLHYT